MPALVRAGCEIDHENELASARVQANIMLAATNIGHTQPLITR